ncbi:hypothetical protein UA08_03465 [Talaromyces atroroseus]|uniref:Apurinic-apyrimidinic endonuclease 1 n=1 Tax=Talaromyces atroroseus TaxID=1441469 RepID=A0A225AI43_TALAT|nr:hypothetical protein UA08_03465 [Talaromyces atroroseus]OKL61112.1 hypothetical protein UA08_03465 [Talaromyces atroroseus]
MPARRSRLSSGAAISTENKKRSLHEPEDEIVSPRRNKRGRYSAEYRKSKSASPVEANTPRKSTKQGSTNSKARRTAKEIITEEPYVEEDSKATYYEVKVEVNAEEETITTKSTTKRKTKGEKEAEMSPLGIRTKGLQMFVGAHVSAAKGVQNSIVNSVHIGGNAFALFLKSQRKWDNPPLQDEHKEQFRKFCLDHQYDASKYILPHGSYLVNLAQEEEAKAKQAFDSFLDDLRRCEQLGIKLYNFHPGAVGQSTLESAISRLANALTKALSETETVTPVLETMCGHGTTIGGPLSELGAVISQIPEKFHSRIGVCIDTCHSFAYGYDLVSPEGFNSFMQEFDDKIGLKFLRALHLNDSKAPQGSKRDLHANIGTGFLGLRAFHNVMNEERFQGLPMILETPIDRPGPDIGGSNKSKPIEDKSVWAREIKLLESLIGMDPESSEFRSLEAQLSDEGRAERQKHQEQYERKLETEAKKKQKSLAKGQKNLDDMFKGRKGGPKKPKTTDLNTSESRPVE